MHLEIKNPKEIRRVVNAVKADARSGAGDRPSKRFVLSQNLQVDFSECDHLTDSDKVIQADDLATLIAHAPGYLERVELNKVSFLGDFTVVTTALVAPSVQKLRDFSLFSCRIPPADMISLGKALAKLSMLEELYCLFPFGNTNHQPWKILDPIVKNSSSPVKRISVSRFSLPRVNNDFETAQFCSFFTSCGSMVNLQELKFEPHGSLEATAVAAVGQMMRETNSLRVLKITGDRDVRLGEVAAALKENQSLTSLSIKITARESVFHRPAPNMDDLSAFHDVLKRDCLTLTELTVDQLDLGVGSVQPRFFNRLLGQNNRGPSPAVQEHLTGITFYLMLNKIGRNRLLASAEEYLPSTDEWMDAISDQDDVSIIFYFLRKNPSLCLPEKAKPKDESSAQETTEEALQDIYRGDRRVLYTVNPCELCPNCQPRVKELEWVGDDDCEFFAGEENDDSDYACSDNSSSDEEEMEVGGDKTEESNDATTATSD